jgi:hypothetical protein
MSTPDEPFEAHVRYALARQPITLAQAQALVAERKRQATPPPPPDPALEALAIQRAAIIQARDLGVRAGIDAGIAAGRAFERVEERNRRVR